MTDTIFSLQAGSIEQWAWKMARSRRYATWLMFAGIVVMVAGVLAGRCFPGTRTVAWVFVVVAMVAAVGAWMWMAYGGDDYERKVEAEQAAQTFIQILPPYDATIVRDGRQYAGIHLDSIRFAPLFLYVTVRVSNTGTTVLDAERLLNHLNLRVKYHDPLRNGSEMLFVSKDAPHVILPGACATVELFAAFGLPKPGLHALTITGEDGVMFEFLAAVPFLHDPEVSPVYPVEGARWVRFEDGEARIASIGVLEDADRVAFEVESRGMDTHGLLTAVVFSDGVAGCYQTARTVHAVGVDGIARDRFLAIREKGGKPRKLGVFLAPDGDSDTWRGLFEMPVDGAGKD